MRLVDVGDVKVADNGVAIGREGRSPLLGVFGVLPLDTRMGGTRMCAAQEGRPISELFAPAAWLCRSLDMNAVK